MEKSKTSTERVSPTAYYTGQMWIQNDLAPASLATRQGKLLYRAMQPFNAMSRRIGAPSLEGFLLARHSAIDAELERAIEAGNVSQVIEIAAGLTPRGLKFSEKYPELTYIETDLPRMVRTKRELIRKAGLKRANLNVLPVDILKNEGRSSLSSVIDRQLQLDRGTAIITEGLLNYFSTGTVYRVWKRIAGQLQRFPNGLYLSDLHVLDDNHHAAVGAFVKLLSNFVRGAIHLHFDSPNEAMLALRERGFSKASLRNPPARSNATGKTDVRSAGLVQIIRAETRPSRLKQ